MFLQKKIHVQTFQKKIYKSLVDFNNKPLPPNNAARYIVWNEHKYFNIGKNVWKVLKKIIIF